MIDFLSAKSIAKLGSNPGFSGIPDTGLSNSEYEWVRHVSIHTSLASIFIHMELNHSVIKVIAISCSFDRLKEL